MNFTVYCLDHPNMVERRLEPEAHAVGRRPEGAQLGSRFLPETGIAEEERLRAQAVRSLP